MQLAPYSLEATRPTRDELVRLRDLAPAGMPLYLSRVPAETMHAQAETVMMVRDAGFEPVPHIAARRITTATELSVFLAATAGAQGMRRALIVAGDSPQAGPYADALSVIRSGKLREAGIEEIGIAGYPEPHQHIPADAIATAMQEKMAAAKEAGLRLHIVTQFSFNADAILKWVRSVRAAGIQVPIKIGMAGPTKLTALLRYAARCGVSASLDGLASGAAAALMSQLGTKSVGPDGIVEALSVADDLGDSAPHYFSFGGLLDTATYAGAVARTAGHRAINASKG